MGQSFTLDKIERKRPNPSLDKSYKGNWLGAKLGQHTEKLVSSYLKKKLKKRANC